MPEALDLGGNWLYKTDYGGLGTITVTWNLWGLPKTFLW